MRQTVSIIVTGKVQGVFYRQSTREKAISLGITGEVKNMPDDTVHIVATGTASQIEQLIAWCRKGPPRAVVESVESTILPLQDFSSFTIARK
jgi:acylphosphatase